MDDTLALIRLAYARLGQCLGGLLLELGGMASTRLAVCESTYDCFWYDW